jgi:hypothetical protein
LLGAALWFVVALGVTATLLLDAAAVAGRAGVQSAANRALEAAMHDAVADYQNQLASAMAPVADVLASPQPFAGVTPSLGNYAAALAAMPNPLTRTFAAAPATGPQFTLAYQVVPTTVAPPACATAVPSSGPDAIAWLQCSGFVQESRLSLVVSVEVLDAVGAAVLARRDQGITLRLFAEPPYSAVVGRKDSGADDPTSGDALAQPAHEGDVGGDTVSGVPPVAVSPWPAGGTLIHVRYWCDDGAGQCANAAPPDPDGNLRFGTRWANGNHPAP